MHIIVGNLHFEIIADSHSTDLLNLIEPFVFDWTGNVYNHSLVRTSTHCPLHTPHTLTHTHTHTPPTHHTASHKGSISAEHGLGFKKAQYIYHSKSSVAVDFMKNIKKLFDSNNILNPYKTLP